MECEFLQDDIDFLTWMKTTSHAETSNLVEGQCRNYEESVEETVHHAISVESGIPDSAGSAQGSPLFNFVNIETGAGNPFSDALLKVEREKKNRILKSENQALRRQSIVSRQSSKRRLALKIKIKQDLFKVRSKLKDVRKSKSLNWASSL